MPPDEVLSSVRAVVFDFTGTLTTAVPAHRRYHGHARVAEVLECAPSVYISVLLRSFFDRAAGYHGGPEQTMRWVATEAGTTPTDGQIRRACDLRRQAERDLIRTRPGAARVLAALRATGLRTAVVSDCTHEVPELWPTLPLAHYVDATVFSIRLGTCKPDEDMYTTAARALRVRPRDCLYVGDGGSRELTGAAAAGMWPVMLRAPDSRDHAAHDPDVEWSGPRISRLDEVLDLVVRRPEYIGW